VTFYWFQPVIKYQFLKVILTVTSCSLLSILKILYEFLQLSSEWKKMTHVIIDALKFLFPDVKAGSWKFIGDDICSMQRPNEYAVTCLIVAESLCQRRPVPGILLPRDFHNARQRFWKIAKSLEDLDQFYWTWIVHSVPKKPWHLDFLGYRNTKIGLKIGMKLDIDMYGLLVSSDRIHKNYLFFSLCTSIPQKI